MMNEATKHIQRGDYIKAEEIIEKMLEMEENNCEATTLMFLVQINRKKERDDKRAPKRTEESALLSLIKSISLSQRITAYTLEEIFPPQELIRILERIKELGEGIELVKEWIYNSFIFILKDIRAWEEREIESFFTFIKMPRAGERLVDEGFGKGIALIKMTSKVWETLGLEENRFEDVKLWVSKLFVKRAGEWGEKEIRAFFDSLGMGNAGEKVIKQGFNRGTALLRMTMEDWIKMGLKMGEFCEVLYYLENQNFSLPVPEKSIYVPSKANIPWDLTQNTLSLAEWKEQGGERLKFKRLVLQRGEDVFHKSQAEMAIRACEILNIPPNMSIERISLLHNDVLSARFNANLDIISTKWKSNPTLYRKKDWKKKDDKELREWYMKVFEDEVEKCDWNEQRQVLDF